MANHIPPIIAELLSDGKKHFTCPICVKPMARYTKSVDCFAHICLSHMPAADVVDDVVDSKFTFFSKCWCGQTFDSRFAYSMMVAHVKSCEVAIHKLKEAKVLQMLSSF